MAVRRICRTGLEEEYTLAGEELFWNGQAVNRMLFIIDGSLQYCHLEDPPIPVDVVAGSWCCEVCIWAASSVLSGPLVGNNTGCELLKLDPSDIQDIARIHPQSLLFVVEYARRFVEQFNELSKDVTSGIENLLFNSKFEIKRLVVAALSSKMPQLGYKKQGVVDMDHFIMHGGSEEDLSNSQSGHIRLGMKAFMSLKSHQIFSGRSSMH